MPEFAVEEPRAAPRRAAAPRVAQVGAQPAAPAQGGAGFAQAQVHGARPGDLRISVNAPATIGQGALTDPKDIAPSAALSFELGEHGRFRQDEFIIGDLTWMPRDGRGGVQSVEANFVHAWPHDTAAAGTTAPPSVFYDTHLFSLQVGVAARCAQRGAQQGFDWMNHDWRFAAHAKFVDTVEFAKRTIKRVYYFSYRAEKRRGADLVGRVDYTNVDRVDRS